MEEWAQGGERKRKNGVAYNEDVAEWSSLLNNDFGGEVLFFEVHVDLLGCHWGQGMMDRERKSKRDPR